VATTTYSDVELERLRGFPNSIAPDELIRFFTLTTGDIAFVNGHRTSPNRIGVAVQLCTLPWLGFVPDGLDRVPVTAAQRLAETLAVPVDALADYGRREQTRTDHLREVMAYLGWVAAVRSSSRSWISSCLLVRWSTTHPVCCSASPASICAVPE